MKREVALGNVLRKGRYELGWSAEESGRVYGEALRGKPVTRKAYLRMEEGYLPKDPKRRLVLAGMFGLAPALFLGSDLAKDAEKQAIASVPGTSKKAKALDLAEYHASLQSYWQQGYSGTANDALRDIARRIRTLHDRVLYVSSDQKERMKQLLCAFHLRYALIAGEQRLDKPALDHFKDAIILAHEENYVDLEAAALNKRGSFFFDKGYLKAALCDFKAAESMKAPPQLRGNILTLLGLAQMHMAQAEMDKKTALRLIDSAENMASQAFDDVLYQQSFPKERYFRVRARALMSSPEKKLHSSEQAAEILDKELATFSRPELKRLHVYHQIEQGLVEALVWMDRKYYPIAMTTAQNVLDFMKDINSYLHLPLLIRICEDLQASSYGKSAEVGELRVNLLLIEYLQTLH